MFDPEIVKFYNNIKDPTWPEINDYFDFVLLPEHIKQECRDVFNLGDRVNEIVDVNTWAAFAPRVFKYEDFVYVPIWKSATTYYSTRLYDLGWRPCNLCDIDLTTAKPFGLMMHPMKRVIKAIAEHIVMSFSEWYPHEKYYWIPQIVSTDWDQINNFLGSMHFKKLIQGFVISDPVSMPSNLMFGDFVNKVHWILLDDRIPDEQVRSSVVNFCKNNGYNLNLPQTDKRIHTSSLNKLKLHDTIKELFFTKEPGKESNQIFNFYKVFNHDLKLYYQLLDNYQSSPALRQH